MSAKSKVKVATFAALARLLTNITSPKACFAIVVALASVVFFCYKQASIVVEQSLKGAFIKYVRFLDRFPK